MEYRTTLDHLSPSTINVRLSAIRKLIGEARRNGMIGDEEVANLTDIPNVRQQGTRLGNWVTREQAKELLAVSNRTTLKGERDYVIIALRLAALSGGESWRLSRSRNSAAGRPVGDHRSRR